MMTLWLMKRRTFAVLEVEVVDDTEKAVKFQVKRNPKCFIYLPKKAIKTMNREYEQYEIAHWFTGNDFFYNMFDKYGDWNNR
jgi:hypothetical protein